MSNDYVPDLWAGESLGLVYKFRLLKHEGQYVIFNCTDGKIVERIPPQENEWQTQQIASDRLYAINGLEKKVDEGMKRALDETP